MLSSEEKNKMTTNALKTWDEKYNAEKNYTKFVKYYKTYLTNFLHLGSILYINFTNK